MSKIIAEIYELVDEDKLGSGSGGEVYLANHLRLNKKVVLKADKRNINTSPKLLRREVDTLKELSHPHIPQVFDYFEENGVIYTAIDFIDGESLDKTLEREGKIPQSQVIRWAIQILDALSYLHSPIHGDPPRGFVHSDIKPPNLMRTRNGDIYLIDFNVALALGEETAIGCSVGYASPEHYGLDYSTHIETETLNPDLDKTDDISTASLSTDYPTQDLDDKTITISILTDQAYGDDNAPTASLSPSQGYKFSSGNSKKKILPDVRSDIYSLGATLYHFLSGYVPDKDAKKVVPLSITEFSPQIVAIISKAMNPNPDLRYQTAEEMLSDFLHLRDNDPRLLRAKRNRKIACAVLSGCFALGILSAFTGLKRMQTTEQWLKLAEYSQNSLADGDSTSAVNYALKAIPTDTNIFTPTSVPEAQKALTDALGVYDLSDGYKVYETIELPSEPLYMMLSPDGKTAACVYAYNVAIFDTVSCKITATLPVEESALSEVKYLDNDTIIYAGKDGITVFDIKALSELWSGLPATAISISSDGKSVAAVYKDESFATIYNTADGQIAYSIDFQGRHQQVKLNDSFANPNNNLLALNEDGTLLAVSFDDGSLEIFNVSDPDDNTIIFDNNSGFSHFEGGFSDHYFAFSATNSTNSVFAIIDTDTMEQTGGFQDETAFGVQTDESGIYVQSGNFLVKMDPVTGDQTPLVTTSENILRFAISETHTLVANTNSFMFFDKNANLLSSQKNDVSSDFVQISEGVALIGSMDSSVIRILRYENHPDTEVFAYDTSYEHDEARISADGETITLFSYDQFRVYSISGELLADVEIPNADQVYDQQFIRDEEGSRLEVTYYDGTVVLYSAEDGVICDEKSAEPSNSNIIDTFETDQFRIESPLHGTPQVYDIKSGKLLYELSADAYLTYVTQVGDYIVTQYITASDGYCYGQLLNDKCEVLAELPYLCDVYEETLYFDYPSGNVRQSRIFNINELKEIAKEQNGGT